MHTGQTCLLAVCNSGDELSCLGCKQEQTQRVLKTLTACAQQRENLLPGIVCGDLYVACAACMLRALQSGVF